MDCIHCYCVQSPKELEALPNVRKISNSYNSFLALKYMYHSRLVSLLLTLNLRVQLSYRQSVGGPNMSSGKGMA